VLVLNETIANLPDYRADAVNTTGKGQLVRALQRIGDGSLAEIQQIEMPHSNRVMTRWIVRRAIQGLYPEVVKTIDWSNPKFDAAVEIRSPAAILLREAAEKLVDQYLEHSTLEFEPENVYTVGPVIVDPKKFVEFKNGLHDGYSDLSDTEREYADAIDATGVVWARNPVNGGFSVPLLEKGDRRKFFPDFLVWKGDAILALDPKGGHLIGRDSGTKLLEMLSERGRVRLIVRLFTEGKWQDERTKIGPSGITLWGLRAGRVKPRHFESISAAVQAALAL
jgi:type III restriction enzyme